MLVWAHGGSFVGGSVAQWADVLGTIAVAADVTVVGVDYRLAPAWRHPAAVVDVLDVVAREAARQPDLPVLVAGDSAGATIAFSATLQAAARGSAAAGALLLYPPLDPRCRSASYEAEPDLFPTAPYLRRVWQLYAGARPSSIPTTPIDVRARELLDRVSRTRIVVGCNDPVRDDCAHLEKLLGEAGGDVRCDTVGWLEHGALLGTAGDPDSPLQEWIARAVCELVDSPTLEASRV